MSQTSPPDAVSDTCPIYTMLRFLSSAWTAHILWILGRKGPLRFGALRRDLPGDVSPRVLSQRLKELAAAGLVHREEVQAIPLQVVYSLTAKGYAADGLLQDIERLGGAIMISAPEEPRLHGQGGRSSPGRQPVSPKVRR